MSHTPGPYTVKTRTNGVCAMIETRDGKELAMLDCGTISFLDNVSNANLFAAAPDMLKALEQALPFLVDLAHASDDESHYREDTNAFRKKIEAIIAKAKGKK